MQVNSELIASVHYLSIVGTLDVTAFPGAPTLAFSPLLRLKRRNLYAVDGRPRLSHLRGHLAIAGKGKTMRSKVKYTCPVCGLNAWAKPGVDLVCGDGMEKMIAEDEGD